MSSAFVLRLTVLPLLVGLSACTGAAKATHYAEALFKKHHDNFLAVAQEVARCTGTGTLTVFYDGTVPMQRDPRARGEPSCPDTDAIAANLKAARIKMAYITADPPYGSGSPAGPGGMGVVFVISSRDDVQQTQGSAIYYFVTAQEHRRHYLALTSPGGHWFFRLFKGMQLRIG